jgi:hypothetical protein
VELCPWRDANGNVDVRLFARDHFFGAGAGMNETFDPVAEASSFGASGTAIAQGEEFSYAVGVTLPAPGRTLTVTMVRETPPGAPSEFDSDTLRLEQQSGCHCNATCAKRRLHYCWLLRPESALTIS